MKKLLVAFSAFLILSISFASAPTVITPKALKASAVIIQIGKGKTISLLELSTISRTDLEKLTGKKMNFFQRMAFNGAQKKLQKGINSDGVVTNKKLQKIFDSSAEGGFHLGGFALGFLAGLIGVLVAYLIKDDLKPDRVKWAWIGLAAAVVLGLILFLTVLKSSGL